MSYDTLEYERAGEISTITLNRPDKRNAVSTQMIDDLLRALGQAETDPVRAVIITGTGKAFCSGMDLSSLRAMSDQAPEEHLKDSRLMAKMFHGIYSFPKPVIAAVNGAAIGGGCAIATLADFTLAVPEAATPRAYMRSANRFMAPALVSAFLRRQIGEKRTRDLLLSGRIIDAVEAQMMGLVSEIVSANQLLDRSREIAGMLVAASPTSVSRTKHLLLEFDASSLLRGVRFSSS